MVQTRSNSGLVEDPASNQALGDDNGSAKSSSRKTIPEAPQRPARDNVLPVGKDVRLLDGQEAFKNPGAMGIGDSMEVDALPGNEESGREDENEIAAEIKQLKKEQKKI